MSADSPNLYVGIARLEVHVPEARSLKDKRSHVRGLVERLRSRHQVLVLETEGQNLHQTAAIAVCAISTNGGDLEARLQRVRSTVDETFAGHVVGWNVEIFEADGEWA